MKKIIVFNLISLDGYFAATDRNIDWHNVDDEYRLLVNPVVLGKPTRHASQGDAGGGKPMFANMRDILKLKLLKTRAFKNGNVLLSYSPRCSFDEAGKPERK